MISWYTIGVGDLLCDDGVGVGVEGGGWVGELELVDGGGGGHLAEGLAQELDFVFGDVELAVDDLLPRLELIQRLIHHSLLPQEYPPTFQIPNTLNLS